MTQKNFKIFFFRNSGSTPTHSIISYYCNMHSREHTWHSTITTTTKQNITITANKFFFIKSTFKIFVSPSNETNIHTTTKKMRILQIKLLPAILFCVCMYDLKF